jgi:hypothetical protein
VGGRGGQGVVDQPCPGVDLCALEISLQLDRLQHRGGLGESDEDDLGLLGVLQTHQWSGDVHALAHVAGHVAVVGAGASSSSTV